MAKYNINIEKTYKIPKEISVVAFENNLLIIAPLSANWIVLKSSEQLDILNFLANGKSIKLALESPLYDNKDVTYVVTQIEARSFCDKKIWKSSDNERTMHLYLTNKCNLRCPHCYMYSGSENLDELSTEEILKLFQDYKTIAKGKKLTISGGEPSTHTDFDLIVKKASNLGLQVKLLTNGTLMNDKRIESLACCLSSVQISIDGYSEESNAIIRGVGHFEKSLKAVDRLLDYGIETSIAVTPSLDLLRTHSTDYVNFAKELINKYKDEPFEVKFAEGLSTGRNIKPSEKSNVEYAAIVKNIQKAIYGAEYELMTFVENINSNVILDNCMFGIISVASNGDVFFCPEIGSLQSIANIRTAPFSAIYNKSKEAEEATKISKLKPCNQCELLYICGGGCRIKEFPQLVKQTSFENIDYTTIQRRNCPQRLKEKFYRLMIESNEYLYTPIGE